ncbi:hypothetical protein HY642_02705 [Candidatus Woesearchaeota archaeon]|nr:hypothetical protein [Candidatus Woesearchaeota archaeon]
MNTTIQISMLTKQRLDNLKIKEGAKSYDEVLQHLLKKHIIPIESMFGAFKGMTPWNKETDRARAHGE